MRTTINRFLEFTLVSLMSVMVLSALLQVGARFVDLNVPFTEELTIYAMMWVTLLGSAYTFGLRKHIAIEVLHDSLRISDRWRLEVIVELIIGLFALIILCVGGSRFVYITFKLGQVSSVMQVPKGWIYMVLPLSGLVTIIYNVLNMREIVKNKE